MTEIKPTMENLNDPYVIQLIRELDKIEALLETVEEQAERIRELEDGSCRFNCRKIKDVEYAAWYAAWFLGLTIDETLPDLLEHLEKDCMRDFVEWKANEDGE